MTLRIKRDFRCKAPQRRGGRESEQTGFHLACMLWLGGSRIVDFSSFPEGALIKHSFIAEQNPCGTSFPRDMLSVHVRSSQLQGPPLCILKAQSVHGQRQFTQ